MFKIIFLLLGLAVGFGGGVYWAHHNPEAAGQLSAAEEKEFLKAQLAITQKIQAKLDSLGVKTSAAAAPKGATGFLGAGQAPNAAAAQQDVNDLKAETQKQQQELQKRLDALK
jgi:hypothetical protein